MDRSTTPAVAQPPVAGDVARPRLVVAVVIDQLPTWALDRYRKYLSPDGALRTGMDRGVYVSQAFHSHSSTYTAPGHATIFTGVEPARHGVIANKVWDPNRQRNVPAVDDGVHAVLGTDAFASPERLRVDGVADHLRGEAGRRAHIVSLSMKDRGAVLPGGHDPDLALWYDKKRGVFTTSTYYTSALPEWLTEWQRANPVEQRFESWTPDSPGLLREAAGADDVPLEGDWHGLGRSFPHDPRTTDAPNETFLATPASSEYLLDLARACVEELDLGGDRVPDLLTISISGTDYVGHTFGPESWEYLDNLIRVDRALGAFLRELEARTDIAVVITSDHGAAPIPELDGHGRILSADLIATAQHAAERRLGKGRWIASHADPIIYLGPDARAYGVRDEVVAAVIEALEELPTVYRALDAKSGPRLRRSSDPLERAIGLSLPTGQDGIYVVARPHVVVDADSPEGFGTSHGSPWSYDRNVPVVVWGTGVRHSRLDRLWDMRRLAPTLGALLGLSPRPSELDPIHVDVPRLEIAVALDHR